VNGVVAAADRGRRPLDVGELRDVAGLVLAADLSCDLGEALAPPGEEDAAPSARGELPR
jgi:hypothetical protein